MTTADGLNVTGADMPFRDTVKLLGVTLDSGLTIDQQCDTSLEFYAELQVAHACTASHPPSADARR